MSTEQVIPASYDPSVSGLPGNVGDIVGVAGGAAAWVKFDSGITDWRAFPGEEATASTAGITDGVTLDGDGSEENPYSALPLSALSWRLDVLRRIKLIDTAFNVLCWSSDCNNILGDFTAGGAAGTGTVVLESTTNGGSLLSSSGTTNSSTQVLNPRDTVTTSPAVRFVSNSRTQKWAVYVRAQVVSPSNAPGKFSVMAALQDSINDNYMGVNGTISATNWVQSVGGVGIDLGVAADLLVHDLLIVNDGTLIKSYLDWVNIGASQAASGVAAVAGFNRWYSTNGTTGANVAHRTFRAGIAVVEP